MNRGLRIGSGIRLGGLGTFGIKSGGVSSDTTPPTIVISSSESSPSSANPIPLIFTLSEPSTDFAVGDITVSVTGTSLGNFAGSGANYTADLTITGSGITALVDVAANAFHDAAGNGNTAATQYSIISILKLKDEFVTTAGAPLSSPRTCEPGPGALTIVDTGNRYSVATDELLFSSASANLATFYSTVTAVAGLGVAWRILQTGLLSDGAMRSGFGTSTGVTDGLMVPVNGVYDWGDFVNLGSGATIGASYNTFASVIQSPGGYVFMGSTLLWVSTYNLPITHVGGRNEGSLAGKYAFFRVAQLGAPYTSAFGIATNRTASPGVGATTTQEANALVEMTWQAVTGQTWNLYVRHIDDTHTWAIRCNQGSSTIKLIEINDTETERASAAQTFNNGTSYRVTAIMDGSTIKFFVNTTVKGTYASATYNQTETGVKTDRAGTNLIAWPRTLSGSALSALQKITNP